MFRALLGGGVLIAALAKSAFEARFSPIPVTPRLRSAVRIIGVATAAIVVLLAGGGDPAHATINASATPLQVAQSMVADASVVTGAAYVAIPPTGTPNAVSDTPLASFPTDGSTYAILTTGNAALAPTPNTSPSSGSADNGANVRGNTDYDVTILRIDLSVPAGVNCLVGMEFRFLSEEYSEFVGSTFNDAFVAELDSSTWTTSGSTISAPNNFAFDPVGNVISVNAAGVTSMTAANASGTTYDGATPLLTAATPIGPGAHSLYLSIFDQSDGIYDSAVFIDELRFGTVNNVSTDCRPGAVIAPPGTLYLDVTPGNGLCVAPDTHPDTTTVLAGTSFQVGICLEGQPAAPSAFEATILFNSAVLGGMELPDLAPALSDNPDANNGGGTNFIGTSWDCSGLSFAYPKISTPAGTTHIVCNDITSGADSTLTSNPGLLATATYTAVGVSPGTSLSFTTDGTSGTDSAANADCSQPGTVCDGATVVVLPAADIRTDVSAPLTASAGQPIQYTLTVQNQGPSTATNVNVYDDMADGWPVTSVTVDSVERLGSGCAVLNVAGFVNLVTCALGPMANSDSHVVVITATTSAAAAGQVVNPAIAGSGSQPGTIDEVADPEFLSIEAVRCTLDPTPPLQNGLAPCSGGQSPDPNTADDPSPAYLLCASDRYDGVAPFDGDPGHNAPPPNSASDYVDYVAGSECDNVGMAATTFGGGVSVSPVSAVNAVGTTHSVTATVTDTGGNPVPSKVVTFSVSGANSASGTRTTNGAGVTPAFTYTGANVGADTITASATIGSQTYQGSATKTWVGITLAPPGSGGLIGELHTVTGTVTTGAAGVPVTFSVGGVNPQPPTVINTVTGGTAVYSYTGFFPGDDTITAQATLLGTPVLATATRSWALPGNGKIFPVAGGNVGDQISPLDAALDAPAAAVAIPGFSGRVYVADTGHNRVRLITPGADGFVDGSPDEIITTVAGTGPPGLAAEGARAVLSPLNAPQGVAVDAAGNVYVSDTGNHIVWRIEHGGDGIVDGGAGEVLTRIAGLDTGTAGHTSESGMAAAMKLDSPHELSLDTSGNLLVADTCNHRIRRIDAPSLATMTTVAGGGLPGCLAGDFLGDGGPATSARLNRPTGVTALGATDFYIADSCNHRIRRVTSGTITTRVGSGPPGLFGPAACGTGGYGGDGGDPLLAVLNQPTSVTPTLYIVDSGNQVIRKVTGSNINPAAGSPNVAGFADGAPLAARFSSPVGIFMVTPSAYLVSDAGNHRLRRFVTTPPPGAVTTVAGTGGPKFCGDTHSAVASSCVSAPEGLAVDQYGNLYIADTQNQRVRFINVSDGSIRTVAGTGQAGYCGDTGAATLACLNSPADVAVDIDGKLYISDRLNHVIRVVSTGAADNVVDGDVDEIITTFAGDGTAGYVDNLNAVAKFQAPRGLVFGPLGLYVADTGNCRVRLISGGSVTTLAGDGTCASGGDGGGPLAAQLNGPRDVATRGSSIYIADTQGCRVRRVDGGTINTVAGTGTCGFTGDGGPATAARLDLPAAVAFGNDGELVIADQGNHRLRTVLPGADLVVNGSGDELMATNAGGGTPTPGFCGDGGDAIGACLNAPAGLARGDDDNLYLSDLGNDRVRKVPADCDDDGLIDSQENGLVLGDTERCNADTDSDRHKDPQSSGQNGPNLDPYQDNCPIATNPTQANSDAGPLDNGPGVSGTDFSVPFSDALGDACDPDADNDGLPNANESPLVGCVAFNGTLAGHPNPVGGDNSNDDNGDGSPAPPMGPDTLDNGPSWDTDNDGTRDGAECALGTNPRDRGSKPTTTQCANLQTGGVGPNIPTTDADNDGLTAAAEYCKWGTSDTTSDTDGDLKRDCIEANDTDGNGVSNFTGDTINSAKAALGIIGKTVDFDLDGNGLVNFTGDTILSARVALHVGGICA